MISLVTSHFDKQNYDYLQANPFEWIIKVRNGFSLSPVTEVINVSFVQYKVKESGDLARDNLLQSIQTSEVASASLCAASATFCQLTRAASAKLTWLSVMCTNQ